MPSPEVLIELPGLCAELAEIKAGTRRRRRFALQKRIGAIFKALREEKNISVENMAVDLAISARILKRVERGADPLTGKYILRHLAALHLENMLPVKPTET